MILNDKASMKGVFSIKTFNKDGEVESYTDDNLIVNGGRENMASLIAGVTVSSPINRFIIGTKGHMGSDILQYTKVNEINDVGEFNADKNNLFSQDVVKGGINYQMSFDPIDTELDITVSSKGQLFNKNIFMHEDSSVNTVQRILTDRTVTYIITIIPECANRAEEDSIIAYTEAALYCGSKMFSMKTFPARVKEDTVKFEITWSIIF